MPHEIIDIGTVKGTTFTRVIVRAWPTEEDRQNGTNEFLRSHDYDANILAPTLTRVIRDAQGRVKLTTGEFVDEAELEQVVPVRVIHPTRGEFVVQSRERKPGMELAKETIPADPLARLNRLLDASYQKFFDYRDNRQELDQSDPAGVFAHPDMAALREEVLARKARMAPAERARLERKVR